MITSSPDGAKPLENQEKRLLMYPIERLRGVFNGRPAPGWGVKRISRVDSIEAARHAGAESSIFNRRRR